MDSKTLNSRFQEVSEQIKKAVADDPALSAMIGVLLVMFESQSALNNSQSEQIKSQSELIESQSSEIKQLTKRIETLTLTIEKLSAKLGNKSITVRKTTNENINGKGSERKNGIDSSSKEKKQKRRLAQYLQEKMVDVTSTSESMTHLRKLISILASDILVTANCR